MKQFLRKVSLKRFKNWSTPSQLTFLIYRNLNKNRLITITALVFSFIGLYFNLIHPQISSYMLTNKAKNIETKLIEFKNSKDWFSHSSILEENENIFNNVDWYNYHKCINSFHSNSSITANNNHLLYFKKISPESIYYAKAIKGIIANYKMMTNKKLVTQKMNSLITLLKSNDYSEPEYYLSLLMAYDESISKEYIFNIYKEIKENNPIIFNKPAGNIQFQVKKAGMSKEIFIQKLSKLYGITFMCSYMLSKNIQFFNIIKGDLLKMFPSTNEYMIAEYGMTLLNVTISKIDKEKYKDFVKSFNTNTHSKTLKKTVL